VDFARRNEELVDQGKIVDELINRWQVRRLCHFRFTRACLGAGNEIGCTLCRLERPLRFCPSARIGLRERWMRSLPPALPC